MRDDLLKELRDNNNKSNIKLLLTNENRSPTVEEKEWLTREQYGVKFVAK